MWFSDASLSARWHRLTSNSCSRLSFLRISMSIPCLRQLFPRNRIESHPTLPVWALFRCSVLLPRYPLPLTLPALPDFPSDIVHRVHVDNVHLLSALSTTFFIFFKSKREKGVDAVAGGGGAGQLLTYTWGTVGHREPMLDTP